MRRATKVAACSGRGESRGKGNRTWSLLPQRGQVEAVVPCCAMVPHCQHTVGQGPGRGGSMVMGQEASGGRSWSRERAVATRLQSSWGRG